MFDPKSRYCDAELYQVTDHRGRVVQVVATPEPPAQRPLGVHLRREGERLDHLAAAYLGDPAGAWRIGQHAEVMLIESLTEAAEVPVPQKEP